MNRTCDRQSSLGETLTPDEVGIRMSSNVVIKLRYSRDVPRWELRRSVPVTRDNIQIAHRHHRKSADRRYPLGSLQVWDGFPWSSFRVTSPSDISTNILYCVSKRAETKYAGLARKQDEKFQGCWTRTLSCDAKVHPTQSSIHALGYTGSKGSTIKLEYQINTRQMWNNADIIT